MNPMKNVALTHSVSLVVIAIITWAAVPCWAQPQDPYRWVQDDPLAAACANLGAQETEKFRGAAGLMDLRPICLPRDEWLYRDGEGVPVTHLGWPVAVKHEGVIHVFFSRIFSHSRGLNPLSVVKGCVVARSTDQGETFHPVPSLKNGCLDDLGITTGQIDHDIISRAPWLEENGVIGGPGPLERMTNMQGGAGPNAVGVVDGQIVVASARGVYRSADNGENWELLEGAGMPDQIPTFPRWGQGPELLVHPELGLISLAATEDAKLLIRTSKDLGNTWRESVFNVGEPIQEPSGCFYDGKLILMPRTERATKRAQPGIQAYYQYWFDEGMTTFQKKPTNIVAGERDTTDVKYNPVSRRIEALVTNRFGGGPGLEQDNCMTLNLWSITPEVLLAGGSEWRFDGTLLRSEGREHDRNNSLQLERDGMCPGGTTIDVEKGLQYIYVYLGHFTGPTGIFQIRRTLDTDALRAHLLTQDVSRVK
jgi:hypothetical protein